MCVCVCSATPSPAEKPEKNGKEVEKEDTPPESEKEEGGKEESRRSADSGEVRGSRCNTPSHVQQGIIRYHKQ